METGDKEESLSPKKKKRKRASSGISEGAKSDTAEKAEPADVNASCEAVAMESETKSKVKKKKKCKKGVDVSTRDERLEIWSSNLNEEKMSPCNL